MSRPTSQMGRSFAVSESMAFKPFLSFRLQNVWQRRLYIIHAQNTILFTKSMKAGVNATSPRVQKISSTSILATICFSTCVAQVHNSMQHVLNFSCWRQWVVFSDFCDWLELLDSQDLPVCTSGWSLERDLEAKHETSSHTSGETSKRINGTS